MVSKVEGALTSSRMWYSSIGVETRVHAGLYTRDMGQFLDTIPPTATRFAHHDGEPRWYIHFRWLAEALTLDFSC